MKIRSKAEFFEKWAAGVLGNRTNLWRDPWEAYFSQSETIGFRQIGKSGGGAWERVPRALTIETATRWKEAGRLFIMDDGCPDWCLKLQGEISRTYRGLEGTIDTIADCNMRKAAALGRLRPFSGSTVLYLLNKFMDPSSQEDLWALLELYPDATIEFSCFGVDVGIFPNRNTLFWETRDY